MVRHHTIFFKSFFSLSFLAKYFFLHLLLLIQFYIIFLYKKIKKLISQPLISHNHPFQPVGGGGVGRDGTEQVLPELPLVYGVQRYLR
jgi:hypothetical protein